MTYKQACAYLGIGEDEVAWHDTKRLLLRVAERMSAIEDRVAALEAAS